MMGYFSGNGLNCGLLGGGGIIMMLGGLLIIGLMIYCTVKLTRKSEIENAGKMDESLNILNIRLAKSEISQEEYKAIKDTIYK
jgi:uncharacterized membrane protein